MKITMKTIAEEAGVSVTTVSYVINGTKKVSVEKHNLIMDLVKKYNYVPNSIAKSLRIHTTKTAGLVVSSFPDAHITNIVNGIERRAQEVGYNLLFVNTNENYKYERDTIQMLHSKMIDGLILSPTSNNLTYLKNLIDKDFPIVFVNRFDDLYSNTPRICADDFQAGFEATNHLIQHGHTTIGLIAGRNNNNISTIIGRLQGYKAALLKHHLPFDQDLIIKTKATVEGGRIATRQLLSKQKHITALFPLNNLMTIGAMHALKDLGLDCPKDIAVVGCGDFDGASLINPPITTIGLSPNRIGIKAFDALLNKINDNEYCEHINLPTSLIVRNSCGC